MEDNYRPTQELNGRTVYYHEAMGDDGAGKQVVLVKT